MIVRTFTLVLTLFLAFTATLVSSQCAISTPIQVCQGNCGPVFWLSNDPPGTTYAWTINCGTITNPNAANPHTACFNTPGLCQINVEVKRPGQPLDTCTAFVLVEPTTTGNFVEVICQGDSVEVNGTYYFPGIYMDTIFGGNVYNCDSFLVIVVAEIPIMYDTIATTFCSGSGDSIIVNGTVYNESNPTGNEIIFGSMGCVESATTINLTYAQPTSSSINYTGCHNDGYAVIVGGNIYNESNPSGIDTLSDINGCDSVVTIMLVFEPLSYDTISYSGCTGDGYSITVDSILYNESNPTGSDTMTAANGCDSIITIALIFSPPSYDTISYQGCQGDGYSVNVMDSVFNESNPVGIITFHTSHCDSIIVIDLMFADCPDSLVVTGHQLCVSGTGSQYSWYSCYGIPLPDTTQCITVADTGCTCVRFTDGSGFDTLCLQYNLCNLTGEILAPQQACAGDLIRISFESNDSTLEGGLWTVMLDSSNTQTYELTDSLWLTFDSVGCFAISLMLQDSGCTTFITDTICIVAKPSGFICCDQLTCDSCVNLTVYFEGTPPFSFAITDGISIDTISEINNLAYDYLVCPPYDTTVVYTLLWVSDQFAACEATIYTASASVSLEPFPEATISVRGDTLCAGPAGQFYHWVDCQDTTSLGFDQCFVPTHSGCYCVTVRTVLTDCEDTACINYVISATHDINGSADSKIMYETDKNSLLIRTLIQHTEELNIELFDLLGRNIPFEKKEYPDDASIRIYLPANVPSLLFASISSQKTRYTQAVFIPCCP